MTMHRAGGIVIAPINNTMFGCRYFDSIEIYVLNSVRSSSFIFGLNIFLTATSTPQYLPRCIVLNPPIDICSPISRSYIFISSTPFLNYAIVIVYFYFYSICFLFVRSVFRLAFISFRYIFYYH